MHEPWFYCPTLRTGENTLEPAEARHAQQSLRLQPGQRITLFDGQGHTAIGVLAPGADAAPAGRARGRRASATTVIVDTVPHTQPPHPPLTLIVAACKGPRLDWLVEKCTELGAAAIILAEFEHSVVHGGPQHVERLQRTAIAACKQARRAKLPLIAAGDSLESALAARHTDTLAVAHPEPDAPGFGPWLASTSDKARPLAVLVGPEGGLSETELHMLRTTGASPVSLGPHTLRVETAAVAVAAAWAAHIGSGTSSHQPPPEKETG